MFCQWLFWLESFRLKEVWRVMPCVMAIICGSWRMRGMGSFPGWFGVIYGQRDRGRSAFCTLHKGDRLGVVLYSSV